MKRLLIKSLILLFLLENLSAQQNLLNRVVELKKDSYVLKELFIELQEVHVVPLSYGNIASDSQISFIKRTLSLREVLDLALKNRSLTYQERKGKILIIPKKGGDNKSGKSTLSGYIRDGESGEALIGATVYDKVSRSGTITNGYGFYSLTLLNGEAEIQVSYLGYDGIASQLSLEEDQLLSIELTPVAGVLDEVTITGTTLEDPELSPQMSIISLSSVQMQNVPMVLGEHDILKAIQLLPGIQGGNEGSSGIYVRGGGPDQNLILLDGVPVYNTAHLFGMFSVFNSDAINKVDVIKGGFPARFGGRLSSVIDISMKEGNNQKLSGTGTVGLISSKFLVEGPIKNEKTSFIVSGRRTYLDLLAIPFDIDLTKENNYYFYDFNAKINHRFSSRDRIFFSFYGGQDNYDGRRENTLNPWSNPTTEIAASGFDWGNLISIFRWTHVFDPRLFGAFSLTHSQFKFNTIDQRLTTSSNKTESLEYASGIEDISFKADFDYQARPGYNIKFGASGIKHQFNTGVINFSTEAGPRESERDKITANEYSAYVENDLEVNNRLRFNVGVHTSFFRVDDVTYSSVQPRISGRWLLGNRLSIKASYSEMAQFIHLLTNGGIGLPTDLWVPATKTIKPQLSRQGALGFSKVSGPYEISIEGYYKEMDNLIEYSNGASYLSTNTKWENKVEVGEGTSRGVELLVRKNSGRLTGWVGYTLSKTDRQFDQLNFGRTFDYKYDRRHDLSATGSYQLKKNLTFSSTWVYGTGNALSIPVSRYINPVQYTNANDTNLQNFLHNFYINQVENFDQRNNYRMRSYHRLDLSISWKKQKKRGIRTWKAGVYNAYNRQNPFYIYVEGSNGNNAQYDPPTLNQTTLFPAIPFVNYSFKF
ncbi:MAG: TonB-dependent receptor [Cyclobacteriaceae bacterium]